MSAIITHIVYVGYFINVLIPIRVGIQFSMPRMIGRNVFCLYGDNVSLMVFAALCFVSSATSVT